MNRSPNERRRRRRDQRPTQSTLRREVKVLSIIAECRQRANVGITEGRSTSPPGLPIAPPSTSCVAGDAIGEKPSIARIDERLPMPEARQKVSASMLRVPQSEVDANDVTTGAHQRVAMAMQGSPPADGKRRCPSSAASRARTRQTVGWMYVDVANRPEVEIG